MNIKTGAYIISYFNHLQHRIHVFNTCLPILEATSLGEATTKAQWYIDECANKEMQDSIRPSHYTVDRRIVNSWDNEELY